jgi:hypothetical protein
MDEIDRVGRLLKARAGEADLDQVWREEWAAMADRVSPAGPFVLRRCQPLDLK